MDFVKREPEWLHRTPVVLPRRTGVGTAGDEAWGPASFRVGPLAAAPKLGQLGTMMNVTGQITKFAAKRQRDAITSRMKDSMSFHTSKV